MFMLILPPIVPAQEWVARYNGPGNGWDGGNALAVDSAGNVYFAGSSDGVGSLYDYATIKYSSTGVEQWIARYNSPDSSHDRSDGMVIDNASYIYVIEWSRKFDIGFDFATIKYSPVGIEESRISQIESSKLHATILSEVLQLPKGKKCKVFDITGRVLEPDKIQPGIYFIEVDGVVTRKVVKVR